MKYSILLISLLFTSLSFAFANGKISGVVTDKNKKPLAAVTVTVKETNVSTTTDEQGNYTIDLAAGKYTLEFKLADYITVETSVTVLDGKTTTANQILTPSNYNLKEVVIKSATSREKETAILLDQKKAMVIKQSIGAQEMSRKGVSDVEEGLTKITGITKVEGRGLFVRGLEDRYNNLLVNELQTPSNSPFKKIIPLDLFPTDVVGVLNVYKTFNTNISGDFAGATVNIETAQTKEITKLNIGFGYTTNNNLSEFLLSNDATTTKGTLGFIANDRKLPSAFGTIISSKITLSPTQHQEAYGNNTWDVTSTKSPLNSSIGFLHGKKFKLNNERNFSYLFSINAENDYNFTQGVDRFFNLGQGDYDNNLITTQYIYKTNYSGLLSLKYKTKRLNTTVNSVFIKAAESRIQDQYGVFNNKKLITNQLVRMNQFEESLYWNNQVLADYKLTEDGKHSLKAGGSFVKTSYQQPDRKFIVGELQDENTIKLDYGGNNLNRQYLDIRGNYYFSSLLEYNLKFGPKEKKNNITFGYNNFVVDMRSSYRFFSGRGLNKSYTTNLNTISTPINEDIRNGIIAVKEESNGEYRVKFNQMVNAGYFNLFLNFGTKWDVNAGLRAENSDRKIKYREQGDAFNSPYRQDNDMKLYLLPTVNTKYALNDKSNLRMTASKTITRPVAMELLPINYINPDGTAESGNKDLKDSENINLDFKFELFPNNKEMFAIGLFGKMINNPIERVFIPTANSGGQITSFKNSKEALLFGAEIELNLQLSRIHESLSNFSWGFNTSVMKTDVTIDFSQSGNQLENKKNRKLQGASDWLINSDLKYDFDISKNWKNSMTLVYNVYGDRIFAVGSLGIDHNYEKSFSKLDFIWTNTISKKMEIKLVIDNIINPRYIKQIGNNSTIALIEDSLILRDFRRGTGFSVNLGYSF